MQHQHWWQWKNSREGESSSVLCHNLCTELGPQFEAVPPYHDCAFQSPNIRVINSRNCFCPVTCAVSFSRLLPREILF